LNPIKISDSIHKLSIVKRNKIFANLKPTFECLLMNKVNMAVNVKFAVTRWTRLSFRYNQFSLQGIRRTAQLGSVYLRTNLTEKSNLWIKYECRQTDRQTGAAQLHKNKKQGWTKYGCWINTQLRHIQILIKFSPSVHRSPISPVTNNNTIGKRT
jgi:hypothetical protein